MKFSIYREITPKDEPSIRNWLTKIFPEIDFIWEAPDDDIRYGGAFGRVEASLPLPIWFDTLPRSYQSDLVADTIMHYFIGINTFNVKPQIYLTTIKIDRENIEPSKRKDTGYTQSMVHLIFHHKLKQF